MTRRHHGYYQRANPALPSYKKYPLETRFFRTMTNDYGQFLNFYDKNWDTGRDDDFQVIAVTGGINRGTYYVRRVGEYYWTLENLRVRYRADRALAQYMLKQEYLDNAGIQKTVYEYEMSDGGHTCTDNQINKYLKGILAFENGDFDINGNANGYSLFHPNEEHENIKSLCNVNLNVTERKYFNDPQTVSWRRRLAAQQKFTISAKEKIEGIRIIYDWNMPEERDFNDMFIASNDVEMTQCANGNWRLTFGYSNYSMCGMVVFPQGLSYEELLFGKEVKIQYGEIEEPLFTYPIDTLPEIALKENWQVPFVEDFEQLFGMCGYLDADNIMKHCFVSPDDEVPYDGVNTLGQDILGVRFTPSGHRNQTTGAFIDRFGRPTYGTCAFYDVWKNPDVGDEYTSFVALDTDGYFGYNLYRCVDYKPTLGVLKFFLRNIRLVKRLSDEELGYKLYTDARQDKIHIVPHSAAIPATPPQGLTAENELPKGMLRGLAVRWMNEDRTKVLRPLSFLQAETEKTRDNGEYNWFGFKQ